jgi:hypothetical protein
MRDKNHGSQRRQGIHGFNARTVNSACLSSGVPSGILLKTDRIRLFSLPAVIIALLPQSHFIMFATACRPGISARHPVPADRAIHRETHAMKN